MKTIEEKINYYKDSLDLFDDGMDKYKFLIDQAKNAKKFPEEYEVTIDEDFETGKKFLEALNLKMKSFQETYREKWTLPIKGVHEITFDNWPGLPTFMEIDCTSLDSLNKVKNLLNIDEKNILLTIEERKNTVNRTAPLAAEKNSEKRKNDSRRRKEHY